MSHQGHQRHENRGGIRCFPSSRPPTALTAPVATDWLQVTCYSSYEVVVGAGIAAVHHLRTVVLGQRGGGELVVAGRMVLLSAAPSAAPLTSTTDKTTVRRLLAASVACRGRTRMSP